jgi:hypothetical protein
LPGTDKQKKNFCGYFQPSTSSFNTADVSKQTAAKDQLDALFGIMTEEESAKSADRKLTPEEESKKKLEDLFKSDNNF